MLKQFISILAACAALLAISACSSSDSNSGGFLSAPTSLAGTSISFNPTITFTDANNFTYTNVEVGSDFPAGNINGTYLFTRNNDQQITVTLTAAGIGGNGIDTLDIIIGNFQGSVTSITDFDVEVNGSVYSGTVETGVLVPKVDSSSASGESDDSSEIPDDPNAEPATIDPGFVGTYALTYNENATPGPFNDGEKVTFEITADGNLIFQGKTLGGAFFLYDNDQEAIWFDGTYGYSASGNGSLNEINVAKGYDYRGGSTFLGQFRAN